MNEGKIDLDSEDALDRRLRARPIADEGFTGEVTRRLPAASRPIPRNAVVVGAVAIGSVLVLLSPAAPGLAELTLSLRSMDHPGPTLVALLCMVAVLVGSGVQAVFE